MCILGVYNITVKLRYTELLLFMEAQNAYISVRIRKSLLFSAQGVECKITEYVHVHKWRSKCQRMNVISGGGD